MKGYACLMMMWSALLFGSNQLMIEEVQIKGVHRVDPDLILAESHLEPGRQYTEKALRAALNRIVRLPFVLDAEMAIKKGKTKGHYLLVIDVKETKTYTFSVESGIGWVDTPTKTYHQDFSSFHFGGRWFPYRYVSLFATYDPGFTWSGPDRTDTYNAGIAHHNLFGKNVFASLSFQVAEHASVNASNFQSKSEPDPTPTLTISVPVAQDYWVRTRLTYNYRTIDTSYQYTDDQRGTSKEHATNFGVLISGEYNTLDDNLFPTKGRMVSFSLQHADGDFYRDILFEGTNFSERTYIINESSSQQAQLEWNEYLVGYGGNSWKLAAQITANDGSFTERQATMTSTYDSRTYQYEANLGHGLDLWGGARTRQWGDFRLDSVLSWRTYDNKQPEYDDHDDWYFTSTLSYRGSRALLRFSLSYSDQ